MIITTDQEQDILAKWRLINTAPKDGTLVWLNCSSPRTIVKGYWESSPWSKKHDRGKYGLWRASPNLATTLEPTHWMPLDDRHQ